VRRDHLCPRGGSLGYEFDGARRVSAKLTIVALVIPFDSADSDDDIGSGGIGKVGRASILLLSDLGLRVETKRR
jgi:hypothetical protein